MIVLLPLFVTSAPVRCYAYWWLMINSIPLPLDYLIDYTQLIELLKGKALRQHTKHL